MKFGFVLLAIPLLAQPGSNVYSAEKERALGQQLASEIRMQSKPVAVSIIDKYAKRIGAELVRQVKDSAFAYQFEVISNNDATEPMPLPGGYILIPDRSFVAASEESEIVGMLAHSIGHAALRHGTRPASRGQIGTPASSIPLIFMGGWIGSHVDSKHPQTLLPIGLQGLQATYELEADRFGLELASQAGYDATGFQRYLQRNHSTEAKTSSVRTWETRFARMQEILSSLPLSTPRPSSEEFQRVQQAVRSAMAGAGQRRVPSLRR